MDDPVIKRYWQCVMPGVHKMVPYFHEIVQYDHIRSAMTEVVFSYRTSIEGQEILMCAFLLYPLTDGDKRNMTSYESELVLLSND
jgi:hypothetical protein